MYETTFVKQSISRLFLKFNGSFTNFLISYFLLVLCVYFTSRCNIYIEKKCDPTIETAHAIPGAGRV